MNVSLIHYGCTSSAGRGVEPYWQGLKNGIDHRNPKTGICGWNPESESKTSLEILTRELSTAWEEARKGLLSETRNDLGVILASTKGRIEDYIWHPTVQDLKTDPLTPVLTAFLETNDLKPKRRAAISNACASSHGALYLAAAWLERGVVSHVLILAADRIGPFIARGFQSLGALAPTQVTPFAENRMGLQLGEAASALILSNKIVGKIEIEGISIETEGHSVTRPSTSGASLERACRGALANRIPDGIVAHGTGTQTNDAVEDRVFQNLFESTKERPWIVGTKWSIGHTLGASGSMDIIAASEMLLRQDMFTLRNTPRVDPKLLGRYLPADYPINALPKPIRRVLVTSLGFGGVHAAASLTLKGSHG